MLTCVRPILLLGALGTALAAQCTMPSSIATNNPFSYTHYMGTPTPPSPYPGFSHLFDVVVDGSVNITQIDCILYDDGAVNPSQIGNTASVEVWITPTTYIGNELNMSVWSQIATGVVTVAGGAAHSPMTFGTGFTLPAGTWGVAVLVQGTTAPQPNFGPLHPLYLIPCIGPNNPTGCTVNPPLAVRDQFLDITNLGVQRYAWQSGAASRSINLQIFYTPVPGSGYYTEYGLGCYNLSGSFYEWFTVPPAASDLVNLGIALTPAGGTHYDVGPAAATFALVNSGPLTNAAGTAQLGLNETSPPQVMPFSFTFPGPAGIPGSTSQIIVASNGYVWLGGTDGGGGAFSNPTTLLYGLPRIAAFWGTLDPSPTTGSGSVHFDIDPSNQFVAVTWQGVQEWTGTPGGQPMDFQLVLFANGQVELRYGITYLSRTPVLVGFSIGGGDLDPATRDLVAGGAVQPFSSPDGTRPLHLTAANRPVLGRRFDMVTERIRPGTAAGLLALGTQAVWPGTSLAPFGLPPIRASTCSQYVAVPFASLFFTVTGPQAIVPFTLPSNPAFNGIELKYESLVISPGLNPAGLLASNGLCVHAGMN